jgi:hypothetical protein
MVNIQHKKCFFGDCNTQPNFNYSGEKKALYCFLHKENNMIDVISKKCNFLNCKKRPTFNFEGEPKAIYCLLHKYPGMINIVSKHCKFSNCIKQPNYNFEGEPNAIYCLVHKYPGMINIVSKHCKFSNCIKQPSFNFEFEKKAIYCFLHKQQNMVDIKSKKCIFKNCKKILIFNFEGETQALYCGSHKEPNMINIKSKRCKTPFCETQVTKKYKGYCVFCFINMFPSEKVSRNYKTKEFSVVQYVKNKFPNLDWISDKRIQDGCSKKRPDMMVDLGYKVLIVEIDENQHIKYNSSCENKRIMEISQDVNHRPIVFIRFNPDEYIKNNEKISSCWGVNGNGICCVKKNKQKEWGERLNRLEDEISKIIKEGKEEMVSLEAPKMIDVINLFFN